MEMGRFLRLAVAISTVAAFSTVTAEAASELEDAAEGRQSERCAALVERLETQCGALLDAIAKLSIVPSS